MSSPKPPQPDDGNTNVKYDRQIRIWGDEGQRALQSASVCVIDATATATEILKNLVLPGIASFTVVDGHNVTPQDRTSNLFITGSMETSNRGEAVANAMYDLNESVRGSYVPVDPASFLITADAARQFLQQFSIVIMTQRGLLDPVSRAISTACADLNIPLVYARSYGQIAVLRLQLREHCVYNSRTDDAQPDLRLHCPFPELKACAATPDSKSCTEKDEDIDEAHVPFVVILVRALDEFRSNHDGKLPKTREEKDEFASIVRNSKSSTCPSDAQNYVEALRNAHLRLCHATTSEITHHVTNILNMAPTRIGSIEVPKQSIYEKGLNNPSIPRPIRSHVQRRSSSLVETTDYVSLAYQRAQWWACAFGISKFAAEHHHLPLSGSIPDMTADTASYISLQQAYSACSEREAEEVKQIMMKELPPSLLSLPGKEKATRSVIDDHIISQFCKTVNEIRLVQTRSIVDEIDEPIKSGFVEAVQIEGAMDESLANNCASPYYVALRAADIFKREFSRLPGSLPAFKDDDISRVCALVDQVKLSLGLSPSDCPSWRDCTEELVRYAGVEIHCVAAFIGGVAAQEVIKVVTGQFVPVDSCTIFNMANMSSVTFCA